MPRLEEMGGGLVAQVLPIEMQTLWYGNWQLQKAARIHTSVHWNHLRNVRWDGTSSQKDKCTKPACLDGWEMGVEGGGVVGLGRGATICPHQPHPVHFKFQLFQKVLEDRASLIGQERILSAEEETFQPKTFSLGSQNGRHLNQKFIRHNMTEYVWRHAFFSLCVVLKGVHSLFTKQIKISWRTKTAKTLK